MHFTLLHNGWASDLQLVGVVPFKGKIRSHLSRDALEVVEEALDGIIAGKMLDYHCHIIGSGAGGTGYFVQGLDKDREGAGCTSLQKALQVGVLQAGAGVSSSLSADQEYVRRLLKLHQMFVGQPKSCILAFDMWHNELGQADDSKTDFYTPNDYVWKLS